MEGNFGYVLLVFNVINTIILLYVLKLTKDEKDE